LPYTQNRKPVSTIKTNRPFLPLYATFEHFYRFRAHDFSLLLLKEIAGYWQDKATIKALYTLLKALKRPVYPYTHTTFIRT
jgi:hypothetical protein